MTPKIRYDKYTWNGLTISQVMNDGSLYWKKEVYSLVSPKDPDDYKSEDYAYGCFENEVFAWQWAHDVWGNDIEAKLEIRKEYIIVAKTDGIPADALLADSEGER